MNINDKSVLEMINKLIAINRLNKTQILKMVNLVSIFLYSFYISFICVFSTFVKNISLLNNKLYLNKIYVLS